MVKLLNGFLNKEEAKAQAMRLRFEERTKRFLDAKQRTIGVDKAYLKKQVEEKNNKMIKMKEEGKADAMQLENLCKYLDEKELVLREAKRKEIDDVHKTLKEQLKLPKNNALKKGDPLDLNNCGPSSVQTFQGEDPEYECRKKMQQQQLQQWCIQQEQEKRLKLTQDAENDKKYAEYVFAEDKIRCDMYEQEQMYRAQMEQEVMMENLKLAEERRKLRQDEYIREKELEAGEMNFVQDSPMLCEDTDYAKSAQSESRVRPDHFKGFNPEKSQSIITANASVAAEKELALKHEKELEEEWAVQQSEIIKKMAEMESTRNMLREEDNKIQAETITLQRQELKRRQQQMEREKFGEIGIGFFQKFGTSCR